MENYVTREEVDEMTRKMDNLLKTPEGARVQEIISRMGEIEKEVKELNLEFINELNRPELSEGKDIFHRLGLIMMKAAPEFASRLGEKAGEIGESFTRDLYGGETVEKETCELND